jgi:hypothetical protein
LSAVTIEPAEHNPADAGKNIMKIQDPKQGEHEFTFRDGSLRRVAELETIFIGQGTYQPGWRWSKDASVHTDKPAERHIGYVLEGSFGLKDANGKEAVVEAGQAFEIGPGHDAWVVGDKPCVALDFLLK